MLIARVDPDWFLALTSVLTSSPSPHFLQNLSLEAITGLALIRQDNTLSLVHCLPGQHLPLSQHYEKSAWVIKYWTTLE